MFTGQIISQAEEEGLIKIQYDVFRDGDFLLSSEHKFNPNEFDTQEKIDSYLNDYLLRVEADLGV